MKKRTKILLGIVAVAAVAAGVLCVRQWNNITAARYTLTMDQDAVSSRIAENEAVLHEVLTEYDLADYTPSEEDIAAVASGEKTTQELAQEMVSAQAASSQAQTGEAAAPASSETAASSAGSAGPAQSASVSAPAQPAAPSYDDQVREQVAMMYVLRSTFVSRLDELVNQAVFDYAVAENFTRDGRMAAVTPYLDAVSTLEEECDAEVAKVVAELRRLLKASGQDDSLAKKVEETYEEEKSLKKAYYLKELTG